MQDNSKKSMQVDLIDNADATGFDHADAGATAAAVRNVLVLYNALTRYIGTIADHLDALKSFSRHRVYVCDAVSWAKLDLDLGQFDAVVLHYSLVISSNRDLRPNLVSRLRTFQGYKVLFIQDEYRWVDRTVSSIADLGINLIYTVVNQEVVDDVYHHPEIAHVRRKVTLTGFVPEDLTKRQVPDYALRPIDVGYRARRVPAWLGRFAQEKWHIGREFRKDAARYGLTCDIRHEENQRLYGEKWISFVSNCKAMLGTESGASFIDFSGSVQPQVDEFERQYPDTSFDDVCQRFLGDDGEIVIRVISPRCFEAAALRTLMILYPGTYSGALIPWRHYVVLERDHSNMDDVVAVLRDPDRAEEIIDNAYREVALNPRWSFRGMVEEFDRDIDAHAPAHGQVGVAGGGADVAGPSSVQLDVVERKVNRHFRYWRSNMIRANRAAYFAAHWLIRHLVPARHQDGVVARARGLVRRLGAK